MLTCLSKSEWANRECMARMRAERRERWQIGTANGNVCDRGYPDPDACSRFALTQVDRGVFDDWTIPRLWDACRGESTDVSAKACIALGQLWSGSIKTSAKLTMTEDQLVPYLSRHCTRGFAAACHEGGTLAVHPVKQHKMWERGCALGDAASCEELKVR